jgi:hypothetical protein
LVEKAINTGKVPRKKIDELIDYIFIYKKVCSQCERLLPGNKKYFSANKRSRDGFQSYCRDCGCLSMRAREKNKPKVLVNDGLDYIESPIGLDYVEDHASLDYREPRSYES